MFYGAVSWRRSRAILSVNMSICTNGERGATQPASVPASGTASPDCRVRRSIVHAAAIRIR